MTKASSGKPHILVVCTGNICRSPVAEALLRDRLRRQGLQDWRIDSAGTWANPGLPASAYSVEVSAEKGLDIRDHASHPIGSADLFSADLVLCMESGHVEALRAEFPRNAWKIHLLSEMSGPGYSVKDPYGGPRSGYEQMLVELTNLVDDGLPQIKRLAEANARQRQR
jgi:protein-tyrosine phosphatase